MSPEQFEALKTYIDGCIRRTAIDIANAQMGRLASIDTRLGRIEATQDLILETVRGHSTRMLTLVPPPIEVKR